MSSTQIATPLYLDSAGVRRLNDLLSRFIELSEAELQELKDLRQQHLVQQEARRSEIDLLRQKIRQFHILPAELFDKAALDGSAARSAAPSARRQRASAERPKWRKSDNAPVLLELKPESGRGRSFIYRKGRIYEGMSATKAEPAYTTLPAALSRFGGSAQSILNHLATDEGKQYFATPAGQAELEKIVATVVGATQ